MSSRPPNVDLSTLRRAIQDEYAVVAQEPDQGFHFHTGRPLARILGYRDEWLEGVPESAIESFAGTGCPFRSRVLAAGEKVVDIGCGAAIDTLIAAGMVGNEGRVIGVDMTPAMLDKARAGAAEFANVEIHEGFGEDLPIADGFADVVISNGVFNLMPNKPAALAEMHRVLEPNGRLQLADILVQRAVPDAAKERIELWTG